ncbi:MAG: MFS transporter [Solobacterium sp.]|nr:MFS transporter [Solobacterium sp.]
MKNYTKEQVSVLLKCCLIIGCSLGMITNCMGIFFSPISQSLEINTAQVSIISTMISLLNGFMAPLFVRFVRKYKIHHLMTFGVLLNITALTSMSFTRNIYLMYVFAAMAGMGNSFTSFVPATMILRNWFGERNGVPNGIMMSFTGVAGAILNPVISKIISSFGWSNGFRFMALLLVVISLPCALSIRMKEEPEVVSVKKAITAVTVIPMKMYILLFITVIFLYMNIGMNVHISSMGVEAGHTLQFSATLVSCVMISNVVSKLILGAMADHIHPIKATAIVVSFSLIGTLILFFFRSNPAAAIVGAFLYGFVFAGNTVGVTMTTQAVAKERYSEVYSKLAIVNALSYSFTITFLGFLKDTSGSYSLPLICILCTIILSIVLLLVLYRMKNTGKTAR